ncbi:MAG: SRPBCC family protein [Filimonas sp.]|nr:SRPBCC family protein [Filimonas sp.]
MSIVYKLTVTQQMPVDLDTAWRFFSNPANLQSITPGNMSFTVTSKQQDFMYAGQVIEYTLKPLLGISMYWMTEITHVQDKTYFVDEQRFGPYSLWHHQHHFKEIAGGVEMTDLVHYKIPYWFVGDIANSVLVRPKLKEIFAFRIKTITGMFGKMGEEPVVKFF